MQNTDNIQVFYLRSMTLVDGKLAPKKGVHPVACIAIHRDPVTGLTARGISICAETDNWEKKEGRHRAIARLRKAMGCQCNTLPIGEPVIVKGERMPEMQPDGTCKMVPKTEARMSGINFQQEWQTRFQGQPVPGYKSAWNPTLSAFEKQLLDIADQRAQPPVADVKDIPVVPAAVPADDGYTGPNA